jgi:uncharacterized OB-fold protein
MNKLKCNNCNRTWEQLAPTKKNCAKCGSNDLINLTPYVDGCNCAEPERDLYATHCDKCGRHVIISGRFAYTNTRAAVKDE